MKGKEQKLSIDFEAIDNFLRKKSENGKDEMERGLLRPVRPVNNMI